jgi:cyclic pyranopterin phosphate synthase
MLDRFKRDITYLRISVTAKCNLRCQYCMPKNLPARKLYTDSLSFENIHAIVKEAAALGINKVRLTGGEPLLRNNIEELVAQLSSIEAIKNLGLTTNGTMLAAKAKSLKLAGLQNINISLDTLDSEKYKKITGCDDIAAVLAGIDAALTENFNIKINMVILPEINEEEIVPMQKFCQQNNLHLQLIKQFDLCLTKLNDHNFDRPPPCGRCNRLRLLADGTLKPCLHSEQEYKIDLQNIRASLAAAILAKPESGAICDSRQMQEIGG